MTSQATVREWGLSDGLSVDEKNIYQGPSLSYEKIELIVTRKLNRI